MTSPQRLDSLARQTLEALLGYTHRQDWAARDHKLMRGLYAEWDLQVTTLAQDRDRLAARCRELEELNRRMEWRLAGQGWGKYLRFLTGIDTWPSRT